MIRHLSWLSLALLFAANACGNSTPTQPAATSALVRVFNDSPYTLTNVRVVTGPDAEFTESTLAPGALSGEHAVNEIHETPAVSLIAGGQSLSVTPSEGFAGFNPRLADGSYVLSLNVSGTPASLRLSLTLPVAGR